MRNLDECRQEIFLRSAQRIAKRKKVRRGIMAGCIPMILCAALVVTLLLPKNNEKSSELRTESVGITGGMGGFRVQIQRPNSTVTIADSEKAEALVAQLNGFFAEPDQEAATEPPDAECITQPPMAAGENYGVPTAIQIICCTPDHTEIIYTLQGNILTEEATGKTVTLTEQERAQLESYRTP